MSQNETQNLPSAPHLTPPDYIMQMSSSFYDAAYSLGKYLIAESAETFELAAGYTGRVSGIAIAKNCHGAVGPSDYVPVTATMEL